MSAQCKPDVVAATRFRSVFDQLSDACVWIAPRTGTILDCNAALTRLLGRELEHVIGQPVSAFASATDVDGRDDAWCAMASGVPVVDAGIQVNRSGGALHLSASVSPLYDADGELSCTLSIWRDISQRRRSEVSLRESADSLRALAYEVTVAEARERERVAHGLHDDIGQSLALVTLKLGELGQAVENDACAALVDELRSLVIQAARATRTATFELNCPVLQQLGLQAAIESLAHRMERLYCLNVQVQVDLPLSCMPQAVHVVVFRVIRELLANVQKHAHARNAWVRSHRLDEHMSFLVWDDGVGFEPEVPPRRFGPEGGFGLFSAHAQMRAIGGRLDIDTAPGHGTCVTVTVPMTPT